MKSKVGSMLEIVAMIAVLATVMWSGCSSRPPTTGLRAVGFQQNGRIPMLTDFSTPRIRSADVSLPVEELWIIARNSDAQAAPDDKTPGSGELMAVVDDQQVPMPLKHTDVKASISGYIGSVEVVQQFFNP